MGIVREFAKRKERLKKENEDFTKRLLKRRKSDLALDEAEKTYNEDRRQVDAKYKDRGYSGDEQAEKENKVLEDRFVKDIKLVKNYGKDSMKAKGFATKRYMNGGCVMSGRGVKETKIG